MEIGFRKNTTIITPAWHVELGFCCRCCVISFWAHESKPGPSECYPQTLPLSHSPGEKESSTAWATLAELEPLRGEQKSPPTPPFFSAHAKDLMWDLMHGMCSVSVLRPTLGRM